MMGLLIIAPMLVTLMAGAVFAILFAIQDSENRSMGKALWDTMAVLGILVSVSFAVMIVFLIGCLANGPRGLFD